MTICVTNCLHWIGFHIVNRLIEDGYNVDGISGTDSEREVELSMMLGRNSLFSLFDSEEQIRTKTYTDMILVDGSKKTAIATVRTYNFGEDVDEPGFINIELPLLFGEWMPMNENGVFVNGQYIQFDSQRFQNDAIYIDDFVDCFMQWMRVADLPKSISLTKDKMLQVEEQSHEIQMYIRGNRPIDDRITNLIKHYEKIKGY